MVPSALPPVSPGRRQVCEEWAALSEDLAGLQASPDEETRRLTELFRTGSRPATLKRQPNLQERSSVSNVKTSQTRHWKRTRNSSCVPRSSLWRLHARIAVRRSPILRRGWMRSASEEEKEVIDEARMSGAAVHFASLMDICHLKNAELEPKHQKYKGRVVLRGDIVKDDSGSYAVFTEQGSSSSQMTTAKLMDITSWLPGCSRQAADAVSADTQVKMEDATTFLKIPKSECPDIWIRLPTYKWTKSWSSMLSKAICTVILRQDHYEKSNIRKFYWNTVGKIFKLGMFICQPSKRTFPRFDLENSWKTLTWENQHHFLTTHFWDALKESVKSVVKSWQTTELCLNQDFCWNQGKTTLQSFRDTRCGNNIFFVL